MTFKTRCKLASACLVKIVILYHCLLHTTHPLHTPVKLHTLHFLIISGILPTSILPWQLQTLSFLGHHVNSNWFLKAWHKCILENALQAARRPLPSGSSWHFGKCPYHDGPTWRCSTYTLHFLSHSPTQRWSSLKAEPELIHPHPSLLSSGP